MARLSLIYSVRTLTGIIDKIETIRAQKTTERHYKHSINKDDLMGFEKEAVDGYRVLSVRPLIKYQLSRKN